MQIFLFPYASFSEFLIFFFFYTNEMVLEMYNGNIKTIAAIK